MHPYIHAVRTPDKPALVMAGSGTIVTYRQLDQRSNQAAQLFRQLDLQPGDHLAILLENNAEFLEICWGAQRSGLIYTAISTHLSADEAAYIIDNCDAQLLITSTELAPLAAAAAQLCPQLRHRLMVDGADNGFDSYETMRDQQSAEPISDQCAGIDMLYSSGTTGRPKGVAAAYDPRDITALSPSLGRLIRLFDFTADTVYLSPAPLYHAAPLRFNMMTMFVGGTSVIMEKFDAQQALALIERYGVTHSQWVPIMFSRMLMLPEATRQRYNLGSLRYAIHAAAPCPIPLKRKMLDWFGPVIYEYYSSTESIGACVVTPQEWLQHPGSVGRAIVGTPHIVDEETGAELPPGATGTLYFSGGPEVTYHKDPAKTRSICNDRGWRSVGDVGHIDNDGYVYLTDRRNFMIISGGVNVYPQETENTLMSHALVADAAVFGVPSQQFGEEVKAVVQLRDYSLASDQLARQLIDYCRTHISQIKCPRSIDFIEQLPRLENGKLYKQKLRDAYLANPRS